MAEIVCLIPVLGRPEGVARVAWSLVTASPHVRRVFICSAGHDEDIQACEKTGADVLIADWEPGWADFAKKIDLGFHATHEPWVFQGATDVIFEKDWDKAVLRCAEETGALVVGTWDGANPMVKRGRHSTHTLIARSYCEDPGASWDGPSTVFSTAYDHQCVDNELLELARRRGVWTFCRDARVLHHHPIFDKTVERDATYVKGLANSRRDIQIFVQRRKRWGGVS